MSKEYPCIHYYDDGKCKYFSDDEVTSYCVKGPCGAQVLSNADRIRTMTDEELAEMLSQLYYGREEHWSFPFARKFCDSCPAPEYTLDDGRKMNLQECDFTDGKCPYGSDIVWWLQQPAEEAQHGRE